MLVGVIVHSGDANHGHYFSVTRSETDAMNAYKTNNYQAGQWIRQSDESVNHKLSNLDIKNFVKGRAQSTPYQYYYKRVDTHCNVPIVIPSFPIIDLSSSQQQKMDIENKEQEIDWNQQASNDWNQCSVNELNEDDTNAVDTAMNGVET